MKNLFIKIFLVIFAVSFVFTGSNVYKVLASEKSPSAKACYLIDYNSGTVISSRNENERLPIASMVKIMLLLLSYENVKDGTITLDESVTISKNASGMGGSQVFLEEGGSYKVSELLKCITVASANDASVAIAERLYGSEEACVDAMNKKASELGLKNTLFCNCTGLPKPMQYSSAKDISLIFKELISYDKYFDFAKIWLDKIEHSKNSTEISNTNKLIKHYEGCDGGKTGFTNEAGFCLTATAKRGNMRLIGSVIGAETSKDRFSEMSSLFNNGFNNYTNKCVVDCNEEIEEKLKFNNTKQIYYSVKPEKDYFVFSKRNENLQITTSTEIYNNKLPIKQNQVVGKLTIYSKGVEIGNVNLISCSNIEKLSYFENIKEIIDNWAI